MRRRLVSLFLCLAALVSGPLPFRAGAQTAGAQTAGAQTAGTQTMTESVSVSHASRVPLATVKKRCGHGTEYFDKFGVTREKLVKELSSHEHDSYYLGTPEIGMDWQSPNGDVSYNGEPGTNCAGFVSYVLRKCGLNSAAVISTMKKGTHTAWGSGKKYDMLSSASNYSTLVEKGNLVAHVFGSRDEMLKSGKCEKGDIILRFWTDNFDDPDDHDNHLMIFWGGRPNENKVWHTASGRNHIGEMIHEAGASFVLIKFAPTSPPVAGFEDVREKDWFAAPVKYVKENGLMSGATKNTFEPQSPVTRGQMVFLLWRLAGSPRQELSGAVVFSDVPPGQFYSEAVVWAADRNIASGYPDGTFLPNERLLRQDLAVLLRNYCDAYGIRAWQRADLTAYRDHEKIGAYAADALSWANAVGLINGTAADTLDPDATAPRCHAAAVLMNFRENVIAPQS